MHWRSPHLFNRTNNELKVKPLNIWVRLLSANKYNPNCCKITFLCN